MKTKHILSALMGIFLSVTSAQAQWTAPTAPVPYVSTPTELVLGKSYFIQNVASEQFICAGNSWATQISLTTEGIASTQCEPLVIRIDYRNGSLTGNNITKTDLQGYGLFVNGTFRSYGTRENNMTNWAVGNSYLFRDGEEHGFVDLGKQTKGFLWEITDIGNNVYRIQTIAEDPSFPNASTQYAGWNGEEGNTMVKFNITEDDAPSEDHINWLLYDATEYVEQVDIYKQRVILYDMLMSTLDCGFTVDTDYATSIYNNTDSSVDDLTGAIEDLQYNIINGKFDAASEDNPMDVTDIIVNPDFEQMNANGWTLTITGQNIKYQGASYTNGDVTISHFIEAWIYSGNGTLGDGELSQKVYGLPAGKYMLEADIIAVNQGNASISATGAYLFANDMNKEVATGNEKPQHFTLNFIHDGSDELTIGVKTVSTTANWLAADNFRLTYYGQSNDSQEKSELQNAIVEALSFDTTQPAEQAIKDAFANALSAAQAAYSNNDANEYISAKENLKQAQQNLRESINIYKKLNAYLADGSRLSESIRMAGENTRWSDLYNQLTSLQNELQDAYNQGTISGSSIPSVPSRATNIINEYFANGNNMQQGDDMTILIQNAHFREGNGQDIPGWTIAEGTAAALDANYHNAESYQDGNTNARQTLTDISQVIANLPAGHYTLSVQGFCRTDNNQSAEIYAGNSAAVLKYQTDESSSTALTNGTAPSGPTPEVYDGGYRPNSMYGAMVYFASGYYNNSLTFDHLGGDLTIGLRTTNVPNNRDWVIWDNFQLFYNGDTEESLFADGYYRIVPAMTYKTTDVDEATGGDIEVVSPKYMYSTIEENSFRGKWGVINFEDLRENIQSLWKITKSGSYYDIQNMYHGLRYNDIAMGEAATMSTHSENLMAIEPVVTIDGEEIVNIRVSTQAAKDFFYLHQDGHRNGQGYGGNIVGWQSMATDLSATEWKLIRVSDDEANSIINSFNATTDYELIDAYLQSAETAKELIDYAKSASVGEHEANGLITDASQFSSPYSQNELYPEETDGGNLYDGVLIDGNAETYWHSVWKDGKVASGTHYLQVELNETEAMDIIMSFTRRAVNNDHITKWNVYGTNDTDAQKEECQFLTDLYTPFRVNTETLYSTLFNTQGYRYIRFYIDQTTSNRGYAHLAEFQLYRATAYQTLFNTTGSTGTRLEELVNLSEEDITASLFEDINDIIPTFKSDIDAALTVNHEKTSEDTSEKLAELRQALADAQSLVDDNSLAGSDLFLKPQSAYDQFVSVYNQCQQTADNKQATNDELQQAINNLSQARTTYESTPVNQPNPNMEYMLQLRQGANYLSLSDQGVLLSTVPQPFKWEQTEGGYYLRSGSRYVGFLGEQPDDAWTMSSDPDKKIVITVSPIYVNGELYYNLRNQHGCIGADNGASGQPLYADKKGNTALHQWSIMPYSDEISIVKEITKPVDLYAYVDWWASGISIDLNEITSALRINDINEATLYALNADGSFAVEGVGGWRDANGNVCPYEQISQRGMNFYQNDGEPSTFYYHAYSGSNFAPGETYTARWEYVYGGRAVVLSIVVNFIKYENTEQNGDVAFEGTENNTVLAKLGSNAEGEVTIPTTDTNSGFQVTGLASQAFAHATNVKAITIPETIINVPSDAFDGCRAPAIIWKGNTELPEDAFQNYGIPTDNLLLFVNDKNLAPEGIQNVIVGNKADEIILSDGTAPFYCPQEFEAKTVSYTHTFNMTTGINGNAAGWETITLPFEVDDITHVATGATLKSFDDWTVGDDSRPFWLYELGSKGFTSTKTIKADTPYIIAMPNNSIYPDEYNITGEVTFTGRNADFYLTKTHKTVGKQDDKKFQPNYDVLAAEESRFVLNSINVHGDRSGDDVPGSRFVAGETTVYPFEAYIEKSNNVKGAFLDIQFEDDATALPSVPFDARLLPQGGNVVYNTSGQAVRRLSSTTDMSTLLRGLPAGIYIVNGQKIAVGK